MRIIYQSWAFLIFGLIFASCEKNQSPTCDITSPADESEFYTGETITIVVEASDPDGNVDEMRLFVDDVFVGLSMVIPYVYDWDTENEKDGFHVIQATARDDEGNITEDEIIISLSTYKTFTDSRDNHTYKTVKIGDQIWMAANLAYLPLVSSSSEGSNVDPYYYVYNYPGSSVTEALATDEYKTYGVLYNWQASMDACPEGWHLPTDEEWKELEMALGMGLVEADLLGSRGTNQGSKLAGNAVLWQDGTLENDDTFGESRFTAIPAGYRSRSGYFSWIGYGTHFWTLTENNAVSAWRRSVNYMETTVGRDTVQKSHGISVRCVKDN